MVWKILYPINALENKNVTNKVIFLMLVNSAKIELRLIISPNHGNHNQRQESCNSKQKTIEHQNIRNQDFGSVTLNSHTKHGDIVHLAAIAFPIG
jgi:hypothetical protein